VNRGAVAEVNLSAIAHNLGIVRKIVRNLPVIAVVKADAYGHGAEEVSVKLAGEGVSYLAVAYISEAKKLRDAGIKIPVIVLFDHGYSEDFFHYDLIPVVYDRVTARSMSKAATKKKALKKIHVKIDTGMGRLGLSGKGVVDELIKISMMPGIELSGLLSHFSEADLADRSYALLQIERFKAIREAISKRTGRNIFSHFANSAAVLSLHDAHLDAVRPGLMLYGYSPVSRDYNLNPERLEYSCGAEFEGTELIPAMTIKSKVLCVRNLPSGTPVSYGRTFITKRKSRIGVVPIGYADGYSRRFSNNAYMLVQGEKAPVVGRVCMDLTMIDLTEISNAREDDEVVILGRQGNKSITADELARKADTISYEILTSLGGKSVKAYV
jgi:alanine racemase